MATFYTPSSQAARSCASTELKRSFALKTVKCDCRVQSAWFKCPKWAQQPWNFEQLAWYAPNWRKGNPVLYTMLLHTQRKRQGPLKYWSTLSSPYLSLILSFCCGLNREGGCVWRQCRSSPFPQKYKSTEHILGIFILYCLFVCLLSILAVVLGSV